MTIPTSKFLLFPLVQDIVRMFESMMSFWRYKWKLCLVKGMGVYEAFVAAQHQSMLFFVSADALFVEGSTKEELDF